MDTNMCLILDLNLRNTGVRNNQTARYKLKFLCNMFSDYHKNNFFSISVCVKNVQKFVHYKHLRWVFFGGGKNVAVYIKTLFYYSQTDAHNYKIIGILKQIKFRLSLRHVSVHAGTIFRELSRA